MGKVIALPPSRNIESRPPRDGSAAILFFTGVRYYRLSDEDFAKLAAPAPSRRAKAKPAIDKSGLAKAAAAPRKRA